MESSGLGGGVIRAGFRNSLRFDLADGSVSRPLRFISILFLMGSSISGSIARLSICVLQTIGHYPRHLQTDANFTSKTGTRFKRGAADGALDIRTLRLRTTRAEYCLI